MTSDSSLPKAEVTTDGKGWQSDGPGGRNSLPVMLTVDEFAHLFRVNRKTAYYLINAGLVPGVVYFGRKILIHRDTVLDWAAKGQGCASRSRKKKA